MKKFFITSFIAVVVLGMAFSPYGAGATGTPDPTFNPYDRSVNPNLYTDPGGELGSVTQGANTQGGNAGAAANNGTPKNAPTTAGCVKLIGGVVPAGFNFDACTAMIMNIIMWLVSWVLFLAGLIFDASMYFTIHLSDLINGNPGIPVVTVGWRILRDLANIFFIFILLWIAISTILGLNSGKTKELMVHLIVVALLMNFSLFITQAVIDASNIIAVHFYNLVPGSYSGAFMDGLKIQTIYDGSALSPSSTVGAATGGAASGVGGGLTGILNGASSGNPISMLRIVFMGFFGSILMLTAAYVFLVAAILFLIRTVVLMFVMLLSPLAFLSFALPATEKYGEMWKDALIKQSFFAPAFMVLSYIVVRTIQTPAFQKVMTVTTSAGLGSGWLSSLVAGNQFMPFIMIIVNFLILIGLMLGCILIAKKLDAVGVEAAVEIGKQARGFVGRHIMRGSYLKAPGTIAEYSGAVVGRIPGLKNVGDKISGFGKKMSEGGERLQKKGFDINELDKKFRDSKFGRTELGDFIREKTTGGKLFGTGATFGGEKTVGKSYEESEKLRERRKDLEIAESVKQSMARLKIATGNLAETQEPRIEDFKDENGVVDTEKFASAAQKFMETHEPERVNYPSDAEFDAAKAIYDRSMQYAPVRTAYPGGTMGDQQFIADLQAYVASHFTKPDGAAMGLAGAGLARANKIAADQKVQQTKWEEEIKKARAALGSSINFLSPEGFAELGEHEIKELSPYATAKQIDALLRTERWTMDEKKAMITKYDDKIALGKAFQEKLDVYEDKMFALQSALTKIDPRTGKSQYKVNEAGRPVDTEEVNGVVYAKKTDGTRGPEIPEAPELPSELRKWARNEMTMRDYEIISSVRPEAARIPIIAQLIRYPMVFKQIRFNENIDAALREDLTTLKDYPLFQFKEGNPHYITPNTDEERAKATKEAAMAAKAARNAALAAGRAAEAEGEAIKAFDEVIANMLPADTIRAEKLRIHHDGRAADEKPRGIFRNTLWHWRNMNASRYAKMREADASDLVIGQANYVSSYILDMYGVRAMTDAEKDALNWWIGNRSGREMPAPALKGEETKKIGFGEDGIVEVKDERGNVIARVSLQEARNKLFQKTKVGDQLAFVSDKMRNGLDVTNADREIGVKI